MALTQQDIDEISIAFEFNGAKNNVEIREAFEKVLSDVAGSPNKCYKAFITQTGTNAPVAVEKVNTLGGTPVWARTGVGTYTLTLAGVFVEGDTQTVTMRWYDNIEDSEAYFYTRIDPTDSGNLITFYTHNEVISGLYDGTFNNTPVEINIY